jgi:hypothetical protein
VVLPAYTRSAPPQGSGEEMYLKVHVASFKLRTPEGEPRIAGHPRPRRLRTSSEKAPSTRSEDSGE